MNLSTLLYKRSIFSIVMRWLLLRFYTVPAIRTNHTGACLSNRSQGQSVASYLLIHIFSLFPRNRTRSNQIFQGLEDNFGLRLRSRHFKTLTIVKFIIIAIQLKLKNEERHEGVVSICWDPYYWLFLVSSN